MQSHYLIGAAVSLSRMDHRTDEIKELAASCIFLFLFFFAMLNEIGQVESTYRKVDDRLVFLLEEVVFREALHVEDQILRQSLDLVFLLDGCFGSVGLPNRLFFESNAVILL